MDGPVGNCAKSVSDIPPLLSGLLRLASFEVHVPLAFTCESSIETILAGLQIVHTLAFYPASIFSIFYFLFRYLYV
jgi:hypothetical protein